MSETDDVKSVELLPGPCGSPVAELILVSKALSNQLGVLLPLDGMLGHCMLPPLLYQLLLGGEKQVVLLKDTEE